MAILTNKQKAALNALPEIELSIMILVLDAFSDRGWMDYDFEKKDSHPKKPGQYLIYRTGCDKVQFERWNGTGWAYSNGDCTHWKHIDKPIIESE